MATNTAAGALLLSQFQPNITIASLPNGSVCAGGSLPFNVTVADMSALYVYIEVRGTDLSAPPVQRRWINLERRKGGGGGGKGGGGGGKGGSSGGSSGGSKGGSTGGSTSGGSFGGISGGTSGSRPGGISGGGVTSGSRPAGSSSMGTTSSPRTGGIPSSPPPPYYYSSLGGATHITSVSPPPYSVTQTRVISNYGPSFYHPYPIYTYSPYWYPMPIYPHYPYYYSHPHNPIQTIPANQTEVTRSDQVYDALPLAPLPDFYENATSTDYWSDSSYDNIPSELAGHVYTLRANFFYEKDINSSTNDMAHVESFYFGVSLCDANGNPRTSGAYGMIQNLLLIQVIVTILFMM